jgi:hypothetical protein
MAKGARSSIRKSNNKKLKARVFGPVENARTERLSAKLLELASQPKAAAAEMEVEQPAGTVSMCMIERTIAQSLVRPY